MDTATYNREVVSLRNHVRQARVHVVRRLLKNVDLYKNRKGEDKEKYAKKAERLLQEVFAMKKLDLDKVSRFALNENDLDISSEDDAETRAMKRLSGYKILSESVKQFRERYPGWRMTLHLLQRSKNKKQTPRTVKKKKQKKPVPGKFTKDHKFENSIPEEKDISSGTSKTHTEEAKSSFFIFGNGNVEDKKINDIENKAAILRIPEKSDIKFNSHNNTRFSETKFNSNITRFSENKQERKLKSVNTKPVNTKPIKKYEQNKDVTSGDIHPSWEAKRKLKEKQSSMVFSGTKIKFDD